MNKLFQTFEQALEKRNPALLKLLEPGLPESDIRERLHKVRVQGTSDPIISLYSWKNGTRPTRNHTLEELSPFPKSSFCFEDLELMSSHFQGFREFAKNNSDFALAAERCFPVFWDSSTRWIAVDTDPKMHFRVVLFDSESLPTIQELYSSFNAFLKDAIKANEENRKLTCFEVV